MTDLAKRIAELSPEKRKLLLRQLEQQKTKKDTELTPIPRQSREVNAFPISFSQQRLWFLDQLEPGNVAYNIPVAIRLRGVLHLTALEQSVNEIIRRHESLRTTFDALDEQVVQVIHAPAPFTFPVQDLQALEGAAKEAEVQRLLSTEALQPFDVIQGPLLRVSLLKLTPEEHIFLFTMHHIVSDGWSVGVFVQELRALYEAFCKGDPSPLPELPIQYVDFAAWQKEWLEGEVLERQLAYWKKQLAPPLPILHLPLDYPRPKIQTFNGARLSAVLSESLSRRLKELSQQQGASLFMVLLAAFNVLLYRHTGQSDIPIGSPIAGRNRAELENLIGFFLNTLVLRTNLDGNPSFRELLKRTREVALEAYANQDVPFEKLLEEVRPERDLSRTPIFQIFFNMLNMNTDSVDFHGLKGEYIYRPDAESKFDMTMYMGEQNQQIHLALVYNTDLFAAERIEELLAQYEMLLAQIVEQPDQQITAFSLVTPSAHHLLPDPVEELEQPKQMLLPEMIGNWVRRTPEQIALVQHERQWTYAQLDEHAKKLARLLVERGVQRGDVVAVCGSRSPELIASMLAAFLSGGVLLSIDSSLPTPRKQLMLKEAAAKALVILGEEQADWADMILPENIIRLPESMEIAASFLVELPQLSGDDPAYIFFTSGTTGVPKGVKGNHKGLAHFLSWQRDTFCIQPHDRAAQLTALSFDVMLRDIFLALVSGGTLCLPEDNIQLDANATLSWLQQVRVSLIHTVPTLAQTWLGTSSADLFLPDLRRVFFAGEPLKDSLVHAWREHFPECQIINLYGPTETTMAKCFYQVPEIVLPGIQSVGSPLPQTQALILNPSGQLCGIGEPGEIVIRTPFRTFGYINAPEENVRKFVKNPFRDDEQDLVYYSGDQGRYRSDGLIDILGRIDGQVKVRGVRIELSEIEAALLQHPSVQQAVASIWEPEPGDKRLAAYFVMKAEQPFQSNVLRTFLKERLPESMLPSSFTRIESVPFTPNGKVDRRALPLPEQAERDLGHEQVQARNTTEEKLVQIWQDLLKVKPIGVTDNFFELGGHSLLAVHLFSRIKNEFNVNLPLATLFQRTTIEQLTEAIQKKSEPATWSSLIPIEPQGNHPPFFCIHGVTGDILWFRDLAHALAPHYPFYGLQARGLDGIQQPFSQIEAMATYYITEMRRIQAKGPYFLGGASFGGSVAYEIAQQLLQQGEEVALLAIFDQPPPNVTVYVENKTLKSKLNRILKVARNFPGWFGEFLKLGPERILLRIRRKLKLAQKIREYSKTENPELFDATDFIDFAGELSPHRQQLIMSHYEAMKDYIPQSYRGRVTLFRAKARPLMSTHDPEAAWKELNLGGLDVINVPGTHEGMFKVPHVNYLAGQLKKLIDQASENN